jgi:hypothetical protein
VQINQKELTTIIMKLIQILKQTLGILSQKVINLLKVFFFGLKKSFYQNFVACSLGIQNIVCN